MGFDLREMALLGGQPIRLYLFVRGATTWGYTSADRLQVVDGITYNKAAIDRSAIRMSGESKQLPITVSIPRELAVAANWVPVMPRDRIALTIMVKHRGESDYRTEWIGRVRTPKRGGATMQLTCEPTLTTASRAVMNQSWSRNCQKTIYSPECGVDPMDFELPATLVPVNAVRFTSSAFLLVPSGQLVGGDIEYTRATDGLTEYRTIMAHDGNAITIDFPLYDPPTDMGVLAHPGCPGIMSVCNDLFDNLPQYGGDPYLPDRNPHDGNPIW